MRLTKHIAASICASGGIYLATKSAAMAGWSFATGVLLDVDHLLDYWNETSFNVDIARFFVACHKCDFTLLRLYFHSFEAVLMFCIAAYFTRSGLLTALTLGMAQHIFFDQLSNKVYPAGYIFIYRWRCGFKTAKVFSGPPDD